VTIVTARPPDINLVKLLEPITEKVIETLLPSPQFSEEERKEIAKFFACTFNPQYYSSQYSNLRKIAEGMIISSEQLSEEERKFLENFRNIIKTDYIAGREYVALREDIVKALVRATGTIYYLENISSFVYGLLGLVDKARESYT